MPVEIHGKQYATVAERLDKLADATNGEYSLESEIIKFDGDIVVVKATLAVNGFTYNGHAYEKVGSSQINQTSALENAETSAWGRALSAYGLAGTEIASADEVANAIHQQNGGISTSGNGFDDSVVWFGKHKGKKWSDVPGDYLTWLSRQEGEKAAKAKSMADDELTTRYNKALADEAGTRPQEATEDIPF